MRPATLAVLLVLATATCAAAQESAADLRPGARVRVTAELDSAPQVGRVHSLTGDNLTLTSRDGDSRVYSLAATQRLQVSQGRARIRWAAVGAVAGFAAGVVIQALSHPRFRTGVRVCGACWSVGQ